MAKLPDTLRIYAIGDIHGRADLLEVLFDKIAIAERERPKARSHMVFLGDYIDRGPDSHGVIELLLHGLPAGLAGDFLLGNHEQMMLDALADEDALGLWIANGGAVALQSYARAARASGDRREEWVALRELVPPEHLDFLERLQFYVEYGGYCFTHAGLRPGVPLDRQDPHDLVWIRKPFLDHKGSFGRVVVHGHTPVPSPEVHPNRIAIDTGAVFTDRLTALVLEGERQEFIQT